VILSGLTIKEEISKGNIEIDPYDERNVGPNSYDLTIANEIKVFSDVDFPLDMKKHNEPSSLVISESGFIMRPHTLYLARTNERTFTNKYVPMIEGRSSVGRLGIFVHTTNSLGDLGYNGKWTFCLSCIHPIKIYPNIRIAQIYYFMIDRVGEKYNGNYQNSEGIQESMLFKNKELIG
jgi:dCTP deaminase